MRGDERPGERHDEANDASKASKPRSVLVTHADEPLGRRLVKRLFHDPDVENILAVGDGPPPRSFDRYLGSSGGMITYKRVDLTKHRPAADLFHSGSVRKAEVDTVIYVPRHAPAGDDRPIVAGVAERTAEARLVLQHCLEVASIRGLVAIGSAFVYRLQPGNANRMTETSDLDLDPDVPSEIRSWIDCDMIFHGEVHNDRLRVALLRVPTVVTSGGYVFLNPSLASGGGPRVRPIGFDPMCALVSDKDVARAAVLALHARCAGIFNIAGSEALPLSVLARWTGRPTLPLPGRVIEGVSRLAQLAGIGGLESALDGDHLHYGFTLDTCRAEQQLGYRPSYRIGLSRAGDGSQRIETAPA